MRQQLASESPWAGVEPHQGSAVGYSYAAESKQVSQESLVQAVMDASGAAQSVWGGNMMVHRQGNGAPVGRGPAEHCSQAGSEFNWAHAWATPRFHPSSLLELQQFRSGVADFDVFTHGHEVLADASSADEILEALRQQLLTDKADELAGRGALLA